jgi:hypothetical protein
VDDIFAGHLQVMIFGCMMVLKDYAKWYLMVDYNHEKEWFTNQK